MPMTYYPIMLSLQASILLDLIDLNSQEQQPIISLEIGISREPYRWSSVLLSRAQERQ